MKCVTIVLLSVLLLSCGSENNPLGSDDYVPIIHDDQIFVINTRTGSVFRIKDGERIEVTAYDSELQELLSKYTDASNLVEFSQGVGTRQVIKIEGKSKLVGDTVKVRGTIGPYTDVLDQSTGTLIWLTFTDGDKFQIARVAIDRSDCSKTIDGKGGFLELSFQKDIPISAENYRYAVFASVLWGFNIDSAADAWLKTDAGKKWLKSKEEPASNP